jgi:hypothetical protein
MDVDDPYDFPIQQSIIGDISARPRLEPKTNGHVAINGHAPFAPLKPTPAIDAYRGRYKFVS